MDDKDLTQLSYEELQALAKSYGVTDDASPEVVQLDALVSIECKNRSLIGILFTDRFNQQGCVENN